MPQAAVGPITIEYDTLGDPTAPALLLVGGLGQQLIGWDERFCSLLADQGLRVIRYDNRDVGLSTHLDHLGKVALQQIVAAVKAGEQPPVPYRLEDMAADAVGLLDHLGLEAAHVLGVSMGGMIAQVMALEHQDRVHSLTSIMSTTGNSGVGKGTSEAMHHLYAPPPTDRERAIAASVASSRVIASPDHFDADEAARRSARNYDRAYNPGGIGRQLAAIIVAPDRTPRLAELQMPTLVIHGTADPLIDHSGGLATAEAVPGATIVSIEGMGHDMPEVFWPEVVAAITSHIRAAETRH